MPKTRLPYAPEFRRQMIELVRAGRDPDDLSREFEPTSQSIRNWVAQADRSEGLREEKVEATSSAERDELIKLRREVRQLKLERDILRLIGAQRLGAAACFGLKFTKVMFSCSRPAKLAASTGRENQ